MKRYKMRFVVLLILSVFVLTASGQSGFTGRYFVLENEASGFLAEKTKKKIADDFLEYLSGEPYYYLGREPDYIFIEYLGTYNGCELVHIDWQNIYVSMMEEIMLQGMLSDLEAHRISFTCIRIRILLILP